MTRARQAGLAPPPAGSPHTSALRKSRPSGSWEASCPLRACPRAMNAGCGRLRPQKLSVYQRAGTIPTLENFPAFCARGRAHPGGRFMGSPLFVADLLTGHEREARASSPTETLERRRARRASHRCVRPIILRPGRPHPEPGERPPFKASCRSSDRSRAPRI